MQTRSFLKAAFALACATAFAPAFAQTALDDVMAKKLILIAVPTDSAPYGFVGTDLAPIRFAMSTSRPCGARSVPTKP